MNSKIHLFNFTDDGHFGSLTSLSNPGELRCGAFSLTDKLAFRLKLHGIESVCLDPVSPLTPDTISNKINDQYRAIVLLSSRSILSDEAVRYIAGSGKDEKYLNTEGQLVGFRLNAGIITMKDLNEYHQKTEQLPVSIIEAKRIDFPWHLGKHNAEEITNDLRLAESTQQGSSPVFSKDNPIRGRENIFATGAISLGSGSVISAEKHTVRLDSNSNIGAGAILSAEQGPIWLAENVVIEPGAILQGPVYIGPNSIVRAGARINGDVSLGAHCRVGGELSCVIMQGYSSKQHSGYLGSSVVGQWVNLGAATDNSDLKNNYRNIEVTLDGQKFDSGELHAGVYIGDFVRTAIQTRLNSGTVVGTCCNLFGNDFPDKAIPPYIWYGSDGYQEYRLDKALETIRVIMSRRNTEMNNRLEESLNYLYDHTREVRREFLKLQSRASK